MNEWADLVPIITQIPARLPEVRTESSLNRIECLVDVEKKPREALLSSSLYQSTAEWCDCTRPRDILASLVTEDL